MLTNRWFHFFLTLSLFFLVLFFSIVGPGDPDLGFHLRIGERIWTEKHFPDSNWFNYAFPESQWLAHEAIGEVLIYGLYALGKFNALIIFFSLLMLGIAYVIYLKLKNPEVPWAIHWPIASLAFLFLSFRTGVRLQLFSWLGFALLILGYLAWKREKPWPIWAWLILFLLWANLHNTVIFTLFIILLFFGFNWLFNRTKLIWYWLKVFLVGLIASFIQPIGYLAHLQFFRTVFDQSKNSIMEWQPINFSTSDSQLFILIYLLFFSSLLFVPVKKVISNIDLSLFIISLLLFLSALMYNRNIPFALIALIPVFDSVIYSIVGDFKLNFFQSKTIISFLAFLAVFLSVFVAIRHTYFVANSAKLLAQSGGGYPYEAVQYLKKNGFPKGNVFNSYNFGGYLIYHFPDRKWFIDGRLPDTLVEDPENPGKKISAMEAYNRLTYLGSYPPKLIEHYDINWTFSDKRENNNTLNHYLNVLGWKVLYEDNIASILVKP